MRNVEGRKLFAIKRKLDICWIYRDRISLTSTIEIKNIKKVSDSLPKRTDKLPCKVLGHKTYLLTSNLIETEVPFQANENSVSF